MNSITITLPFPPSMNTYWRMVNINGKPRMLLSKGGRDYRSRVAEAWLVAGCPTISGRLKVSIVAYMPDRRERDLDNLNKAILDSLQHCEMYENDGQIDSLSITRGLLDKANPRVEITITNTGADQ